METETRSKACVPGGSGREGMDEAELRTGGLGQSGMDWTRAVVWDAGEYAAVSGAVSAREEVKSS